MLYVTVGDTYEQPHLAQDRSSLAGKILRITPEGKPAPGNPFPGSAVWSMGHRHVQGLALGRQRAHVRQRVRSRPP
jgi:glucose/arabinose dehydrogenase